MDNSKKVATLPKHATTSEMRRMLERKVRDNAIREANATKKLVDRLLAKRTRKIVPSYRDKALVSSGTGARISMSYDSVQSGATNGIFSNADATKLKVFLGNYYAFLEDDARKVKDIVNA